MLFALAQHIEEARGVVADFGTQFTQCDEFAGACGHLRLLAAAIQNRELHQQHIEPGGVIAERRERGLYARHIAVVIGAPDIDHAVEAALQLVHVVGDVVREIGLLAVVAHQHPVFLVAIVGGTEPERSRPSRTHGRFSSDAQWRDRPRRSRPARVPSTTPRTPHRTLSGPGGCRRGSRSGRDRTDVR